MILVGRDFVPQPLLLFASDSMNVRPVSTFHRCVVITDGNAGCSLLRVCHHLISIYYSAERHTTTATIRCGVATSTVGNQQVAVLGIGDIEAVCNSTHTPTPTHTKGSHAIYARVFRLAGWWRYAGST